MVLGGKARRFTSSATVGCKMKFGVYVPAAAEKKPAPLLIFLSGG